MGRWRPPAPKSAPYITKSGFAMLERELDGLWLRRRDVVQALSAAAAEGDRSENAEYIYRKKELGGIDRRIRYLQKRMPDLNIVQPKAGSDQVFFGAWAELEDEDGSTMRVRVVGADEIDAGAGLISVDSPLAKALLGKRADDAVNVSIDGVAREFVILSIWYAE